MTTKKTINFAFLGTPLLCIEILDELERAGYVPSVVVTRPDRAKGRGMETAETPVAVWARERNIDVLKPEKLDSEFCSQLQATGCKLAIIVAYGKIIPQVLFDAIPLGMFNIHYSLLPRWRGATPVESAILAGDAETGVAIQKMVYDLDAGPIASLEKTPIGAAETTQELRARLNTMAKKMLVELMPAILDGSVQLQEQDISEMTHAGKMSKEDGLLDLSDDGIVNYRKYRAYFGWPGTYAFFDRPSTSSGQAAKRVRGIIVKAHMEGSKFVIDTIKPEGKGEMSYSDFLRSGAKPV